MENEALTSAVCPECGAPVKPGNEPYKFYCQFCGDVTLYTKNNERQIQDPEDYLGYNLRNADSLADRGYFADAISIYNKLLHKYNMDYRIWWGLLKSKTRNFNPINITAEISAEAEKYYNAALERMPPGLVEKNEATYNKWCRKVSARKAIPPSFFIAIVVFLILFRFYSQYLIQSLPTDGLSAVIWCMFFITVYALILGIAGLVLKIEHTDLIMMMVLIPIACTILMSPSDIDYSQSLFDFRNNSGRYDSDWSEILLLFYLSTVSSWIPIKLLQEYNDKYRD